MIMMEYIVDVGWRLCWGPILLLVEIALAQ